MGISLGFHFAAAAFDYLSNIFQAAFFYYGPMDNDAVVFYPAIDIYVVLA